MPARRLLVAVCLLSAWATPVGFAHAAQFDLQYGQVQTGTLAPGPDQQDVYVFTAPTSGRIVIRTVSLSGDLSASFDLETLAGDNVCASGGAGPVREFINGCQVTAGTQYKIDIPLAPTIDVFVGSTYSLLVESRRSPAVATPVTLGVPVAGSLDQPGELDFFTVRAHLGDVLRVTTERTSGSVDPEPVVFPRTTLEPCRDDGPVDRLDNPTASVECTADQTTDTFVFFVGDRDDDANSQDFHPDDPIETGGYRVTVTCVDGPCLTITTTTTPSGATTTTLPGRPPIAVDGAQLVVREKAGKPATRRLRATSRDPDLGLGRGNGSADDPRESGATLRIRSVAMRVDTIFALPEPRWKQIGKEGANEGYRYRARGGPIAAVVVKQGRLKIVGRGAKLPGLLTANPDPVDVVLTMGGVRYCASFGGTSDFSETRRFVAKEAGAPPSCP